MNSQQQDKNNCSSLILDTDTGFNHPCLNAPISRATTHNGTSWWELTPWDVFPHSLSFDCSTHILLRTVSFSTTKPHVAIRQVNRLEKQLFIPLSLIMSLSYSLAPRSPLVSRWVNSWHSSIHWSVDLTDEPSCSSSISFSNTHNTYLQEINNYIQLA